MQIAAISQQASESSNKQGDENTASSSEWRSFDMHSVVAATEDLIHFILSRKGWRVRVFLIQDIVKASDAFLQEATFPFIFDEEETTGEQHPEVTHCLSQFIISEATLGSTVHIKLIFVLACLIAYIWQFSLKTVVLDSCLFHKFVLHYLMIHCCLQLVSICILSNHFKHYIRSLFPEAQKKLGLFVQREQKRG
jgi:hypothetical protein